MMDSKQIDEIVANRGAKPAALIQVLLDIQEHDGWLSKDALTTVGERLGVPMTKVQHTATFYKAFRLIPEARHTVHVCDGTSCHARGARRVAESVRGATGVASGETSPDLKFSLETPICMGRCASGPVVEVDGKQITADAAGATLKKLD
jgi:NADH-quinone oxidoreductase subunit E